MKILVVSPFLPYPGVPHAGGKLVHYLLQVLAEKHSVSLVSRYYPGEEEHAEGLGNVLSGLELVPASGPVKGASLPSLFRTIRSYYWLGRKASEVLKRERFDVCQVEFTETGVFWVPPPDVPAVLTCHDIIAKPAFRRYQASRGVFRALHRCIWKTKRVLEKKALSKFSRVLTLSDEDREWGERFYPGVAFRVLRYPGGLGFVGLPRKEVPGRILFLGAMNRSQNIESVEFFRQKVWPSIRESFPNSEFWVAGSGLHPDLEREWSKDPRIVMTGFVENVEEIYKTASVFVAPILTGGGIIVKILDAMAAGIPVVTTSIGNEGIRAKAGEEILVCDHPDTFQRLVVALLRDQRYRTSLGNAGRLFLDKVFSTESFSRSLEGTYEEIAYPPRLTEKYSDSTSRT